MAQIPDTARSFEAIKLVSDWAKWLVTIETAIITIIGAFFATDQLVQIFSKDRRDLRNQQLHSVDHLQRRCSCLTLPKIAQNLRSNQNIWLTRDSVAGRLLHMNTQAIALIESIFFGFGLLLVVAMIIITIWS